MSTSAFLPLSQGDDIDVNNIFKRISSDNEAHGRREQALSGIPERQTSRRWEIKRKYDRSWCRHCYKAYTMALDTWLARPHDGGSPATTQYIGSERLSDDFAECIRPATAFATTSTGLISSAPSFLTFRPPCRPAIGAGRLPEPDGEAKQDRHQSRRARAANPGAR